MKKQTKTKQTRAISQTKAEAQASKIREEAIPIFMMLKAFELFGLSVATVGVYWYGRLFYYLTKMLRPNWFLTWSVGLACLGATIIALYLIYLIIGRAWLIPNWRWAKRIAARKLEAE